MSTASRISSDVDFGKTGYQQGFLRVPYSSNVSAYGWIPVPIVVAQQGVGRTVLLTAGVHGDEYEGQIVMTKLARQIREQEICGRVIILPALNAPAVKAGQRLSPVDNQNLNRSFPGDPDGGPTAMIAHFIEAVLMPMSDLIIDIHSGGNSLLHEACSLIRDSHDPERRRELRRLAGVFGVPRVLVKKGQPGEEGLLDRGMAGAAERVGKPLISSELGGGGTVSLHGVRLAEDGIRRLLVDAGVIASDASGSAALCEFLVPGGRDGFLHASADGVFEPLVALGAPVDSGQIAARIHTPGQPWAAPVEMAFAASGRVICQRSYGRVEAGDCLFHLGMPE